jgi:hypothetical protein
MSRNGPVLAWCATAVLVGVCGDAVLRFLFSEERASHGENECWCGAANKALAVCEAKRGFLFQFCTTPA